MRLVFLAGGAALLSIVASDAASARERLSRECRREVVQLCGLNRSKMQACLAEKRGSLSAKCTSQLSDVVRERLGDRQDAKQSAGSLSASQTIAFGDEPLQQLDFYSAAQSDAPLILFVHGGGWKRGDESNATGAYKAAHYTGLGYHFASTNYRLVPEATVEQQAADVAAALAELLSRADALGIDRQRVVLMGHSAGAHLVAMVGTDPQYLTAAGLTFADLAGVIPLDGAGYDVPLQMSDAQPLLAETYEQAFGTDRERQLALSPARHAAAPNAAAFLLLHVERDDGKRQSEALAAALTSAGTPAEVRAIKGRGLKGHMEINQDLGKADYPATPIVDAWLKARFGS